LLLQQLLWNNLSYAITSSLYDIVILITTKLLWDFPSHSYAIYGTLSLYNRVIAIITIDITE
ncbi:36121_t:CDS:1, partial [Gigaspora margarita]